MNGNIQEIKTIGRGYRRFENFRVAIPVRRFRPAPTQFVIEPLLLLLDSDTPLIVDQPEDDLDNRFITEGIVPRMREVKQRRQFIFSTHNANIPVLGDAEMILGLSTHNEDDMGYGSISVEHMGAIDSQPVRELVEEILEGGREAFEIRRRKYGF